MSPKDAARSAARSWEARQPPAQRWLNGFCENWIFAFIVAMTIRHFALEAYRIPTASMEPMLYGDEAIAKADHVLVDKLLFRFTGPDRWGVTVFQFPWPEIAGSQGPANPEVAWDETGERHDRFPFNPLMNRNFVKRCVIKPDDVFFISGGDVHLRQEDGSWQVPLKPPAVQEALWLPIYRHGDQADYLPWAASGGSSVSAEDDALICRLEQGDSVVFTQPFWNLYLKPGPVKVGRPNQALSVVEVSLTEPLFTLPGGATGSIWDLNQWQVHRLTTRDLDSQTHGASLNRRMEEWVGDLRIGFSLSEIEGRVALVLSEGEAVDIRLVFTPEAWQLVIDGQEVVAGSGDPSGADWELSNVDNRVMLHRDGEALHPPVAVAATDPSAFSQRTTLSWTGQGRIRVGDLAIDRDVHYSVAGFLADETEAWKRPPTPVHRQNLLMLRRQMIGALIDEELRERLLAELVACVGGKRAYGWLEPIGVSPETALQAPEAGYLLLGDNSPFSWDGRNWGWVPATNLRGQVLIAALLPIGRWKVVH